MRPFRLTRRYYSEYSVKDLQIWLETDVVDGWDRYRLVKVKDNVFTMAPDFGTIFFKHTFLPIVDVCLQETEKGSLVTLTCRRARLREIMECVNAIIIVLLVAFMLAGGTEWIEWLPILLVFLCFAASFAADFVFGSWRHRKKFIQELKLTPIDKNS